MTTIVSQISYGYEMLCCELERDSLPTVVGRGRMRLDIETS